VTCGHGSAIARQTGIWAPHPESLADVVDALLGQVGRVPRDRPVVGIVMQDCLAVMRCGGGDNEVHR
jgi:hypothetical protein